MAQVCTCHIEWRRADQLAISTAVTHLTWQPALAPRQWLSPRAPFPPATQAISRQVAESEETLSDFGDPYDYVAGTIDM